jgi:uncharacterized protein
MIVDTGVLYALADRDDQDHMAARALFALPEPKFVPEGVVAEADYLIAKHLGLDAAAAFVGSLGEGRLSVVCPNHDDRARAHELIVRYRDLALGYVDAIVIAIAERLGEPRVATLDRRDFAAVTPKHVAAFELVP